MHQNVTTHSYCIQPNQEHLHIDHVIHNIRIVSINQTHLNVLYRTWELGYYRRAGGMNQGSNALRLGIQTQELG